MRQALTLGILSGSGRVPVLQAASRYPAIAFTGLGPVPAGEPHGASDYGTGPAQIS